MLAMLVSIPVDYLYRLPYSNRFLTWNIGTTPTDLIFSPGESPDRCGPPRPHLFIPLTTVGQQYGRLAGRARTHAFRLEV